MSFEVVTILFNFHHWACVVGLVLFWLMQLKKRVQNRLFQSHIPPLFFIPSRCNENFHPDLAWLNASVLRSAARLLTIATKHT